MIRYGYGWILAAMSVLVPGAPAYSQDGQEFQLEEIVVTARKREENLQEVPVAISVFTGDVLLERGILSTRDLYANTPGLRHGLRSKRRHTGHSRRRLPGNRHIQAKGDDIPGRYADPGPAGHGAVSRCPAGRSAARSSERGFRPLDFWRGDQLHHRGSRRRIGSECRSRCRQQQPAEFQRPGVRPPGGECGGPDRRAEQSTRWREPLVYRRGGLHPWR